MQLWDSPKLGALAALAGALHVEPMIPGPHPCRPSSEGGVRVWKGLSCPPAPPCPSPRPRGAVCAPTFEVEEEREAVGHHGTLAAHHTVAHEGLRVSTQSL